MAFWTLITWISLWNSPLAVKVSCALTVDIYLYGSPDLSNVSDITLILFTFLHFFRAFTVRHDEDSAPAETGSFAKQQKPLEGTRNHLKFARKSLEIQERIWSCQAGMSLTRLILSLCSRMTAFLSQTGRTRTVFHCVHTSFSVRMRPQSNFLILKRGP